MLKELKGVSVRLLMKEFGDTLRKKLWGGHLWNPSYFVATVSENTEEQIRKTFGSGRFVYNHFLAKRKTLYESEKKALNYNACSAELTELKKALEWLREIDSIAIQSGYRHGYQSYSNNI
jgi:putative transposase